MVSVATYVRIYKPALCNEGLRVVWSGAWHGGWRGEISISFLLFPLSFRGEISISFLLFPLSFLRGVWGREVSLLNIIHQYTIYTCTSYCIAQGTVSLQEQLFLLLASWSFNPYFTTHEFLTFTWPTEWALLLYFNSLLYHITPSLSQLEY